MTIEKLTNYISTLALDVMQLTVARIVDCPPPTSEVIPTPEVIPPPTTSPKAAPPPSHSKVKEIPPRPCSPVIG